MNKTGSSLKEAKNQKNHPVVSSLQQIFHKRARVQSVSETMLNVISEMANGNKRIDLSIHQSDVEMVYVMISKGIICTLHIQELEKSLVKEGGEI
jgi:hypothetical protein